jgi:hypothetical protein
MTSGPATNVAFPVCTLPSPELASRRAEIQTLIDRAGSVQTRHDGVLFTFENTEEIAYALLDFIRFEQQCCTAITYELRAEPPHAELALRLRAPATLVASIQSFYRRTEPPNELQQRVMANGDVFCRVGIVKGFCEMIAPLGAILCAAVCLGLPVVSGTLGIAGMNFLRDDRLLIPFEVLCCGAFLWTFERGRRVHGKLIVVLLAFAAAGTFLGSMLLTGIRSKTAVLLGCIILIVATVLNQVFLRRCSCASNNPF